MKTAKPKSCAHCGTLFEVKRFLQQFCKPACQIAHTKESTKEWAKKPIKAVSPPKPTKSHADHLNELQIVFNRYIRERDKGESCISCNCDWDKSFQSGHFFSVGSCPSVRFHESNVHGQCAKCNIDLNGNWKGYATWIGFRIGTEKVVELSYLRSQPLKLSIPEIIELKEKYKAKIKTLTL